MLALLNHPFIRHSIRFLSGLAYAGVWGVVLSQADVRTKAAFVALLAIPAVLLTVMYMGFTAKLSQVPLYGLLVAGEAMTVGAFVFAFLGAFQGHLDTIPLCGLSFGGVVFTLYAGLTIIRDNMPKRRDLSA